MGITNLKKLINQTGVRRNLSSYRGRRLAVDASIYLYKFIYRDDNDAVLKGILKQLITFHRFGITPVYVFDGKASSDIKIEVERRQERRERVRNTLETLEIELGETLETLGDPVAAAGVLIEVEESPVGNAVVDIPFSELDVPMFFNDGDDDEMEPVEDPDVVGEFETTEDLMLRAVRIQSRILSLQKQARRPTREMVADCKELFELLGVPYVQAPGESDPTLASMALSGEVDGIISEDTDMLPYGCEMFVTGFKDTEDYVTEFRLSHVLAHLKMSRQQFVDLCILCGCDYADKIYKIGVKTGFNMMKKYGSIEKILRHIDSMPKLSARHTYPVEFIEQVKVARNMFLTRSPDGKGPKGKDEMMAHEWNFSVASVMEKEYREFLGARNLVHASYPRLCRPFKAISSGAQRTIMDFFNVNRQQLQEQEAEIGNDVCQFDDDDEDMT
jgi:5'-3' exonuclease